MPNYILEMKNITKEFPGVMALNGVSFKVPAGGVMALLGENGAGKSTLMKILTGVYPKTSGEIYYQGKLVDFKGPKDSQEQGIAIIHQELNLIPGLTIGENIFLGREPRTFGKINWKQLYTEAEGLLNRLGVTEDPRRLCKDLSIGQQQMVEIAKALSLDARVIVMDEPTDALTDKETEQLFRVIQELRNEGRSIIYISHRLKEIFEICDAVTVLRDGKLVGERSVVDISENQLIEMMVGRKLTEQFPKATGEIGEPTLRIEGLSNHFIKDISFQVKQGEILGIAGLMGSRRTELAKTIIGALRKEAGSLYLGKEALSINSPEDAMKAGIAYVSEDRKGDGLVLGLSVKENMSLSSLKTFKKALGKIDKQQESNAVDDFIKSMAIKTPSQKQLVKNLSGGNQQKVSIAKCLMTKPKVLILDEPTRGVDVGAKKEIYQLMNQFKEAGMSIIMISSEIPEVLGTCDRILILHEGRITGELLGKEATQEKIIRYAMGMEVQ